MAINKLVYYGDVLFDTTEATISADNILSGYKGVDKSGNMITGTCTYNADTSGSTATADEILIGETAWANGSKVTGTMPNKGGVTGTISTKDGQYSIPAGYHDGSGKVSISATEKSKIVAGNIKKDVTILGVTGTLETGSQEVRQDKTVTPSNVQQIITPDSGYTCLGQVTVNAIPYVESANQYGTTVTIG